ncbi:hypothetical protein [Planktotalea arctica]
MTKEPSGKRRTRRLFWAAILGLTGALLALLIHFNNFDLVEFIQRLHGP